MSTPSVDPSYYPLNAQPYSELWLPVWDLPCAAVQGVCRLVRGFFVNADPRPEPPQAPAHALLGSLPEMYWANWNVLRFFVDYDAEYGREDGISKMRFGHKTYYLVSNPRLAAKVLQSSSAFVRGASLSDWRKFSPNGLSETKENAAYVGSARKVVGAASLPQHLSGMQETAEAWVLRLKSFAASGQVIDLMNEAERATLATTGRAFFTDPDFPGSKNPFGLEWENEERAQRFIHAFHQVFEGIADRIASPIAQLPWVGDWLYSTLRSEKSQALIEAKQSLQSILDPIFRGLFSHSLDASSFLFAVYQHFGIDPLDPDYEDLLEKSLGFLQASFETASKSLGWTLYHLARDASLQDRIREELLVGKREALQQVMEEILRLYPPFPFIVRDVVDPDAFPEYRLEKGAAIILSPLLIQRRAWADADHFSLERFQGEMLTDGWQAKHEEYATFIRGKHRCPGRHFAKQELLVMLEAFIRHYHVELAEGMPSEPVGLKFSITLQPETPIQVCVRQR